MFFIHADRLRAKDSASTAKIIDPTDLLKPLSILSRAIKHLSPETLLSALTHPHHPILPILSSLLTPSNSLRLRHEGLKLLLQCINVLAPHSPHSTTTTTRTGLAQLFALYNASIPLDALWGVEAERAAAAWPAPREVALAHGWGEDVDWFLKEGSEWIGKEGGWAGNVTGFRGLHGGVGLSAPILTSPAPITPQETLDLLQEILTNLTNLSQTTSNAPLTTTAHVLSASTRLDDGTPFGDNLGKADLGALGEPGRIKGGEALEVQWGLFRETFLRGLFPAVGRQLTGVRMGDEGEAPPCPPPLLHLLLELIVQNLIDASSSTASLRRLLLDDVVNREYVHEIVRQGCLAPFGAGRVGKLAICVVRGWSFWGDSAPSFIQPCATANGGLEGENGVEGEKTNVFLRRYVRFVRLLFLDKRDFVVNVESQVSLMRDGIQYIRLLLLSPPCPLQPQTYRLICQTLLEIAAHVFGRPNRYAGIASPPLAEEICDSLFETIFFGWVYCSIGGGDGGDEGWRALREMRITQKLTKIMSLHLYAIDLEAKRHTSTEDTDPSKPSPSSSTLRLRAASILSSSSKTSHLASSARSSNPLLGRPGSLALPLSPVD
ncbi:hypothetical protein HDU67_004286, partial [Dinochytrium kinnereticum]